MEYELQHLDSDKASSCADQRKAVSSTTISSLPDDDLPAVAGSLQSPNPTHQIHDDRDRLVNDLEKHRSMFAVERRWWVLEILASALSLLGLASLVVVLRIYDGRAQASWNHRVLTLNSLVALLATVTRAAVMVPVAEALSQVKWNWYSPWARANRQERRGRPLEDLDVLDGASRGAWGSLRLLWRMKGLYLVNLGAILTILSLAVDTFSQQALSIDYRRAEHRNDDDTSFVPRSEFYGVDHALLNSGRISSWAPEKSMQTAIQSGILGFGQTVLPVICPTGDCKWPIVPTLGVCGECQNATDWITQTDHNSSSFPGELKSEGMVFRIFPFDGHVFDSGFNATDHTIHDAIIANFVTVGVPFQSSLADSVSSGITAEECSLWFCMQALKTKVSSGILHQEVVGTWKEVPPVAAVDVLHLRAPDRNFTNVPSDFNVAPDSNFGLAFHAWRALQQQLAKLLNGTVSVTDFGYNSTSETVQAIWERSDDMDAWVQNLALAMTNQIIRAAPADHNSHYGSTVITLEPFFQVRWPWLTFPIAVVFGSILFLIVSMWQTRVKNVRVWKSSQLALLLCSVDDKIKTPGAPHVDKTDGFDWRAGECKVTLQQSQGNGWMFKGM